MARLGFNQQQAVAWAINCYGVPAHRATAENLGNYEPRFVIKCLRDAIRCGREGKFMVCEEPLVAALSRYEKTT